jgi:D-amino peptidase
MRARLIMGPLPVGMTLERKYTAVAFVGQHAMANVPDGVMAHSYSSLGIQNMKLNGKPVGEIETRVALAGHFGTPVIFLSGDAAAARELREIVPDAEVAVVKEGIQRNTCETLSAEAARQLIQDKAKASMSRIGKIAPYVLKGPATLEIETTTRNSLSLDLRLLPGAEVVDDRIVRFHAASFWEVWKLYRFAR